MVTAPAVPDPTGTVDIARVQRRTLRLLFGTQIVGGVGVAIGISVGALLAADLGGTGISGLASSAAVVGGALIVIPVSRLMRSRGRRPGLALAYWSGALGAAITVVAARYEYVPLLFLGMFLFGGGTTANLQARYTAIDLADPAHRARQLSLVVWATTIGAVAGPNLTAVAGTTVRPLGLPELSGPFAYSAVAFLLTGVVLVLFLRPDPLLVSRTRVVEEPERKSGGMAAAWRVVTASPAARLGIAAVATGHLIMVGVMAMTPVHIGEVHTKADTLRIVGIVLSLHIAGMYAFSPVFGALADRLGRKQTIVGSLGLLLLACAVAGTAGHDTPRLAIGLSLLGLGWSGMMVSGSTLLTESVPTDVRPAAQGLSDLVMGLAGALAGALSGVVVEWAGYPTLTVCAAIATVPLLALALRPIPAPTATA